MNHHVTIWTQHSASTLRAWWAVHRQTLLRLAIAVMAVLALLKLGDEFRRLLVEPGRQGAIDLKIYHDMVHRWFAGRPVYRESNAATSPPASYVILWLLFGWLEVTPTRWLYAAAAVAALAWLARLIVLESGADEPLERLFVVLMALSMNATGVTIGNGQLIVFLWPMLLAALLLLQSGHAGWRESLLAGALLLLSLVKPSLSAPFFGIVLIRYRKGWLGLSIALAYLMLTLWAARFQDLGLSTLLRDWLARSTALAAQAGYAHLNLWLAALGLEEWALPASLGALLVLGLWIYGHRQADLWLLLGVSAIVARLWVYHRLYDDLLILFPMVTLFRLAKRDSDAEAHDVIAGLLLAVTILAMLAPARLRFAPWPWVLLFTVGHAIVWIVVLIFLIYCAWHERSQGLVDAAACTTSGQENLYDP